MAWRPTLGMSLRGAQQAAFDPRLVARCVHAYLGCSLEQLLVHEVDLLGVETRGELVRDHARERDERLALIGVERAARLRVDDAQRAELHRIHLERRAGIVSDVGRADDERVVGKARVGGGVGHLEDLGRVGHDRVRAEGRIAACL